MFRKTALFAAVAVTLAATSAFAATKIDGTVSKIDAPQGYIWLDNGTRYDVGTDFARGLTVGNGVSLLVTPNGTDMDVVSASPAGL